MKSAFTTVLCSAFLMACSGGGKSAGPAAPPPPASKTYPTNKIPLALADSQSSADRAIMDQAIARAEKENKSVVLEIGAAWCAPCMMFSQDLEKTPNAAKLLADDGYILVKSETEFTSRLAPNDYLPTLVKFFPSFFIYTPGQGWTTMDSTYSLEGLRKRLAQRNVVTPLTLAELPKALEDKSSADEAVKELANSRIMTSAFASTIIWSYDEMKQAIALLDADNAKRGTQSPYSLAEMLKRTFVTDYVTAGALTLDELAADFPEIAAGARNLKAASGTAYRLKMKMDYVTRTEGLVAASARCAQAAQIIRSTLVPGPLSQEEAAKAYVSHDQKAAEVCADLELSVNGLTPELKARIEAMDKTNLENWQMLSEVGDTEGALAAFNKRYQSFVEHYATTKEKYEKALKEAKQKNDENAINEEREGLDRTIYMIQNHEKVSAEVQNAIRNKTRLPVLKIFN